MSGGGLSVPVVVALAAVTGAVGFYFGNSVGPKSVAEDEVDEDYDIKDGSGDTPCKMVLIIRKDLPMTKGKIAAQCAHAAVTCYEKAVVKCPNIVRTWKSEGQAKIALQCDSLAEIQRLQTRAGRLGVVAERIVDAGRTQIDPGTVTVLGLGPAPVNLVNEVSGHLKLL